jgi:hypothetical protein
LVHAYIKRKGWLSTRGSQFVSFCQGPET